MDVVRDASGPGPAMPGPDRMPARGVISSGQNAVRRNRHCPPLSLLLFLLTISLVVRDVGAQTPSVEQSVTLDDAVRQLAERVAAIPSLRGPLRIAYFQEASFAAETGKDWQETFRKELERTRLTVTEDGAANLLRVGLAETPTDVVLSAGVRVNEKEEARIVSLPRTVFIVPKAAVIPIRVDQQLVYQSGDRILDASYLPGSGEGTLVILGNRGTGLVVQRIGVSGEIKQSIPLGAAGARTERANDGELVLHNDEVSVISGGKGCHFLWSAPEDVSCRNGKFVRRGGVELKPACGEGTWKLIADGTEWFAPELLQVVRDGTERKGALLSDFPGPILSVNPGGESRGDSALAVTRNLRTGNYEVYKIRLACGN